MSDHSGRGEPRRQTTDARQPLPAPHALLVNQSWLSRGSITSTAERLRASEPTRVLDHAGQASRPRASSGRSLGLTIMPCPCVQRTPAAVVTMAEPVMSTVAPPALRRTRGVGVDEATAAGPGRRGTIACDRPWPAVGRYRGPHGATSEHSSGTPASWGDGAPGRDSRWFFWFWTGHPDGSSGNEIRGSTPGLSGLRWRSELDPCTVDLVAANRAHRRQTVHVLAVGKYEQQRRTPTAGENCPGNARHLRGAPPRSLACWQGHPWPATESARRG